MILTLGMLLVALFQVTGRIVVLLLDDLELAVNQVLSERGIRVTGLSGDWRMLDPIVRVERLDLPAGHLAGVELEVDMVASVWRGTALARRFQVADLELNLEKAAGQPWRLVGAGEPTDVDPLPFLRHSDQLRVRNGTLRFHREGLPEARVAVSYLGVNRGGEHRHSLSVTNHAGDCDGCRIEFDYHGQEALWPLRPERTTVRVHTDGFLVPRAVLGVSPIRVTALDARWRLEDDRSGGTLSVATEQFDMPGDVTLSAVLEGSVRGRGGKHRGAISRWEIVREEEVWALPRVAIEADREGVSVWLPTLDLGRAGQFLRRALAAVGPAERWLGGLNVRGTAHNLRAAYSTDGGLAYAMTVDDLSLDGYKGVPTVRQAGGELFGHGRGLQFQLNAHDMDIAFPDIFRGDWSLPYAQGTLQLWFSPQYFGLRGLNLRAEALGSRAAGGFAMSRPPDREGQRLLLLVSTDRIGMAEAQQFVPYKLPDGLQSWLLSAPRAGTLHDARLAYQGQFQDEPGELGRRLALSSGIRDGRIRYQSDWPEVSAVDGRLAISGSTVGVEVARAESAGASLSDTQVRVIDNASAVNVTLDAQTDGDALLEFVRTTPLRQWLGFVEPDWTSGGPLRLSGDLSVPLGDESVPLAVRLRADLEGVDLDLPGYRMSLTDLTGSFRYRYPHFVDAAGVSGTLFGEPVTIGARTDEDASDADPDRVHLLFDGVATPADVWRVAAVDDPGVAGGRFGFRADLGIPVGEGVATELAVTSDLTGLSLDLPAGFAKPPELAEPGSVRIRFGEPGSRLDFEYRSATGWLSFAERVERGAIAFDASPPADHGEPALVLSGRLDGFVLDDVLPGEDGGVGLTLPIHLDSLAVDRIDVGDFAVNGATLGGAIGDDGFEIDVDSRELVGVVSQRGDAVMSLSFAEVNVPPGDAEGDPLTPDLIPELPAANVWIDRLMLGEEDYGNWRFELRPAGDALSVGNLRAEVRGVTITASEPLAWRADSGRTRFRGTLDGGDLAEVLPQWGYAPSVETESAVLEGEFSWNGSPLAVDLLGVRGRASARAQDGRFLDVESGAGAQRIFSLLNFTAIAKRMALNFGDVFGRGISFDELTAELRLDEGLLEFVEPMEVEGTGSSFRVTGSVDLEAGRLDNEMIVTLPVSKSLPWYAAYVALANPLAGVGLLVGERVLRRPLEQFSSARYRIGGTLENPEVKFVSVFDVSTPDREDTAAGSGGDGAAASGNGAANSPPAEAAADEAPPADAPAAANPAAGGSAAEGSAAESPTAESPTAESPTAEETVDQNE